MNTMKGFSEKERAYHTYQARQTFVRQQKTIQRRIAELTVETSRARAQIERERAEKEGERKEKEQARAAEQRQRAEKDAALADLQRLKARLGDEPAD